MCWHYTQPQLSETAGAMREGQTYTFQSLLGLEGDVAERASIVVVSVADVVFELVARIEHTAAVVTFEVRVDLAVVLGTTDERAWQTGGEDSLPVLCSRQLCRRHRSPFQRRGPRPAF